VVNVTDGAHVHVGLGSLEHALGHCSSRWESSLDEKMGAPSDCRYGDAAAQDRFESTRPFSTGNMVNLSIPRAADGNRTHDLFLTKEVLYQLSYSSIKRRKEKGGRMSQDFP
jgi:hypothetical protein